MFRNEYACFDAFFEKAATYKRRCYQSIDDGSGFAAREADNTFDELLCAAIGVHLVKGHGYTYHEFLNETQEKQFWRFWNEAGQLVLRDDFEIAIAPHLTQAAKTLSAIPDDPTKQQLWCIIPNGDHSDAAVVMASDAKLAHAKVMQHIHKTQCLDADWTIDIGSRLDLSPNPYGRLSVCENLSMNFDFFLIFLCVFSDRIPWRLAQSPDSTLAIVIRRIGMAKFATETCTCQHNENRTTHGS